jgi:hypothetical protein
VSYFVVADFKAGLDRRRMAATGAPGTLRTLRNASVNRGGEVEKRKAFVARHVLPSGTVGLASLNGVLYVFGTTPGLSMPPGVQYVELAPPSGRTPARVTMWHIFASKLYVIMEWDNGAVSHYYDGAAVSNFTLQPSANQSRIVLPFGSKLYLGDGSSVVAGKIGEASFNSGDTGAAVYDMSTNVAGGENVTGFAAYQKQMAIFQRRATQIWNFSADPVAASIETALPRIGAVAPRSVVSFAGQDVFFLAQSGVRSLRARDFTGGASTTDIGTPIDADVVELMRTLPAATVERAFAEVEPTTDRYWLKLGDSAYVFTYFPGAKISAWSQYDVPAGLTDTAVVDNALWLRAGDTLYLYGGDDGVTYDASEAEVETPYLDGRTIATWKRWTGIDIVAEGTWQVFASFDPNQPDAEDLVATLTGVTVQQLALPMHGASPVVKLRLVTTGAGAAKLGSLAVHYESGDAR